jgi:nucleotide-binding universal stress UspA family protein
LRRRAAEARVPLTVSVRHGDPADVIRMYAHVLSPDLIVMGTHQRSGLERLRAGSVAERVMLGATQPVLIVPSRAPEPGPFERIAVAIDFDHVSPRGVNLAMDLAERDRGQVTVVHAVPRVGARRPATSAQDEGLGEYLDRLSQDELTQHAWRRLERVMPKRTLEAAGLDVRLVHGSPASAITDAADDLRADVIVVGVPRRGAVARAVFGVTAARLLRQASVPVLAVPDTTPARAAESGWLDHETRSPLFARQEATADRGWDPFGADVPWPGEEESGNHPARPIVVH